MHQRHAETAAELCKRLLQTLLFVGLALPAIFVLLEFFLCYASPQHSIDVRSRCIAYLDQHGCRPYAYPLFPGDGTAGRSQDIVDNMNSDPCTSFLPSFCYFAVQWNHTEDAYQHGKLRGSATLSSVTASNFTTERTLR
mmetsp:Transcript_4317/g.10043  ORF Transcript_4317/g.10043 Transcript_4317/m.10043 type:complete len:139 (-) Transcript_4317:515-931(-)